MAKKRRQGGGSGTDKIESVTTGPKYLQGTDVGEFEAQQDPAAYFRSLIGTQAIPGAGFYDYLEQYALPGFHTGYENALARNKRLKLTDYGGRFGPAGVAGLEQGYNAFRAEQDPRSRAMTYLRDNGLYTGSGSDFEDYITGNYMTDIMGAQQQAQYHDPRNVTVDTFFGGQALGNNPMFTGDLNGDGVPDDTSDMVTTDPLTGKKKKNKKQGGRR